MNILLVDDERLAVEVMNRMIDKEKYGFSTIYKALSMKQAQQICEETDIDIIICDIEMPRGSGLDFVQWLLDTGRNPIVIFLTSHAVFSYAQQLRRFRLLPDGIKIRSTGLSVKAGGAGRYEPGFGEGNTKCKE